LIHRLRQKHRIDRLPNDIRGRRSRLGRFVYIVLLFGFFLWLTDLFIGPLLRLEADGLVVAEHISVGVPFAAQVEEVKVTPGAEVKQGDVLARVNSVDLSVDIATLTARNAELLTKRADIQDRLRVAVAVLPIARDRAAESDRALARIRDVRGGGNVSLATWSQALSERFIANERVAELQAESHSAEASLAAVNAALADATRALAQLSEAYGSGIVTAPSEGIVGLSTARPGDVMTVGQPLMLLYRPQRYVLAYLETGTLYSVSAGDEVQITDGFVQANGRVTEVMPVAEQLPEEFRKVFQPRGRSQVARITLAGGTTFPLFAKVRLSGIGWLSPGTFVRAWLERLLRSSAESGRESRPAPGV
jgi:multidrug resistance efflux pump